MMGWGAGGEFGFTEDDAHFGLAGWNGNPPIFRAR